MKILTDTADEKAQFSRTDMNNILELSLQEKMTTLSSITTLTIDIQRALRSWADFKQQLAISTEAIVEVCVHRKPFIRLHIP